MSRIKQLRAVEILDSRGRPTVKATCTLAGGIEAAAAVPSGASTGAAEAHELRDGDPKRYGGWGCLKAVAHVAREIASAVTGREWTSQEELDGCLIELDGTANKSRLGANAVLAVSLAFARAQALEKSAPLYQHFASLVGHDVQTFPRLTINLFSGGKHAGNQIPIQDVLIVPSSADTVSASLEMMYDIYQAAATRILARYGMRRLTADEGGLAPPFESLAAMLDTAVAAIRSAGYEPGRDAHLAVDVASSHFYDEGSYHLAGAAFDAESMIERLAEWVSAYPIVSVEDGLHEDDWQHWPELCRRLSGQALVVGDDLLCTNPKRIARAIDLHACDTLLLKVNQAGTLTEAAAAWRLARSAGWSVTLSVRSGETEDHWAADLAVGWGTDQFKNGSITQSERLAKYNRLLEIETDNPLAMVAWPRRPDPRL